MGQWRRPPGSIIFVERSTFDVRTATTIEHVNLRRAHNKLRVVDIYTTCVDIHFRICCTVIVLCSER